MTDQTQLSPSEAQQAIARGDVVRCEVNPGGDPDNPVLLHYLEDGMIVSESIGGWSAGVIEPVCAIGSDFYACRYLDSDDRLTIERSRRPMARDLDR